MQTKRGFTLIEILIVMLIITISTGYAIYAFGDFGASRRANMTAEQFMDFVKLVQYQSILEMNTLGVEVNAKGYQALRFTTNGGWQAIKNVHIYQWHAFPEKIRVTIKSTSTPAITVTPAGDMNPFMMQFGTPGQQVVATINGFNDGAMSLQK